jgi:subtilase-type serine protease
MLIRSRARKSPVSWALGFAVACFAGSPSHAVVGNDNYTPDDLVDSVDITGVGQMVIDQQNGYIGLCTASLISPRTVILAAHCVNEDSGGTAIRDASVYGASHGGIPIAFFFNANNNVSGNSAIGHWLAGVNADGQYLTRPAENAYNANYVVYNTESTKLGVANNFLQGDIALAALDTPATNIPTWTLLFSALTGPTHVTITGYGLSGTGTSGDSVGIDYRRRVAENTISVLGSLNDQDLFLFPGASGGLPQNLYMLDFNDPQYGTANVNIYDFNIFHDAALPREGITAPGDSGGPLIVDQMFSQQVIAAVLSGGDRFYTGQPSSSYGTTSFYQPLYLFWDWIVANNPYKYVSAKAGDGSWTDPGHWVMDLDPNYVTIGADGKLVNALPTTPAQGIPTGNGVNTPKFGTICTDDKIHCIDIASAADQTATSFTVVDGPGTTNFVPADSDGDATHAPRYYDVTLSTDGTTTLADAQIVIDRLTVNGIKAGLTVAPTGALSILIDTTMYAGNLRVDGTLVSAGDVALMGGILSGSGTVTAPYTTAVLGAIAPGTVGTTGRLSINGSVILSSRAGLLIDVALNDSDQLNVANGTLSLGGTLVVSAINGFAPKWRQTAIIATGDVIEGHFDNVPDTIAGVLYPTAATVAANGHDAEVVTFEAGSFQSVLDDPTGDRVLVGGVLDADRAGSYATMAALYDAIDPLSGTALNRALDALLPNTARSIPQSAMVLTNAHAGYLWQYLGAMDGVGDAKRVVQTGALKLAQNAPAGSFEMRTLLASLGAKGDCASGGIACASDAGGSVALPKGVGAFLAGQKIDGNVKLGDDGAKADIDGYLVALGVDMPVTNKTRIGLSFGFGDADTTLRDQPARTKTSSRQFLVYGRYMGEGGYFVDGFAGAGWQSFHILRHVAIGAAAFDLDSRASGYAPQFGVQAGRLFSGVAGGTVKPAVGLQYGQIYVDGYTEAGGIAALSVHNFSRQSTTVRAGFDSDWVIDLDVVVLKPQVHAFLVGRVGNDKGKVSAGFAAAPGTTATYDVAADSAAWADLGLRLDGDIGHGTVLGFTFNADPGNAGGTYTAIGGSLRATF